jgi:predicted metal-binding membrane protein
LDESAYTVTANKQRLTVIYDAQEFARVRNPVLFVAVAGWILLLVGQGSMLMFAHCPAASCEAMSFSASLHMFLAMNHPASLAAGWALMLVAMMSPVLVPPLYYIRGRSFTHRRVRSTAFFLAGYAAIWMAVGGILLAIVVAVKLLAPQTYLAAAAVVLIALAWQFSPIKQRCLNRCYAHPVLAAFGGAADFDALRFGMTHGAWCVGSCWALMLAPMLLPQAHVLAMAAVAILIFCERLEAPGPLCWRWRGFGKAARIMIAQAQIRLQRA